ncbi:MAG: hypothetical protein ACRDDA_01430, partial [Aeromonas sp.]
CFSGLLNFISHNPFAPRTPVIHHLHSPLISPAPAVTYWTLYSVCVFSPSLLGIVVPCMFRACRNRLPVPVVSVPEPVNLVDLVSQPVLPFVFLYGCFVIPHSG